MRECENARILQVAVSNSRTRLAGQQDDDGTMVRRRGRERTPTRHGRQSLIRRRATGELASWVARARGMGGGRACLNFALLVVLCPAPALCLPSACSLLALQTCSSKSNPSSPSPSPINSVKPTPSATRAPARLGLDRPSPQAWPPALPHSLPILLVGRAVGCCRFALALAKTPPFSLRWIPLPAIAP